MRRTVTSADGARAIHFCDAPVEELTVEEFVNKGLRLSILRGDLVHPVISGNKLWKLRYNLEEAVRLKKETLITFGGAYSNHLLAVACAAKELGILSVGIVRGEEPMENKVLAQCRMFGMEIRQVSRSEYRNKEEIVSRLFPDLGGNYLIPEGGSNPLAVKGCAEAVPDDLKFDHLFVATGTGGTLAGLACGAKEKMPGCVVEGIAVLKGVDYLKQEIEKWIPSLRNWKLHLDRHLGGYNKTPLSLLTFAEEFKHQTGIPLDPIYTGKMMFAVYALAAENYFKRGASILCVHTGGNR